MVEASSLTSALGVKAEQILRITSSQTGDGSEQSIAHKLSYIPTLTVVIMQEGGVSGSITYGTNDATNIKVTVPSGMDYIVLYG